MSYEKQFWEYEPTNDDMEEERKERKEKRRPSEPKADPKEKELYSIKPLEWILRENTIDPYVLTIFGGYRIVEHTHYEPSTFQVLFGDHYPQEYITEHLPSMDEAKYRAQDHFNSKLKLCLNREL